MRNTSKLEILLNQKFVVIIVIFQFSLLMLTTSVGWIWTRESQREIQKFKAQYDKDVSTIKSEMEARYRETLTERRRAAATLELELEKERQRVKGYKQALVSQSQQLMEERKQLQQVKSYLAPSHFDYNFLPPCFTF